MTLRMSLCLQGLQKIFGYRDSSLLQVAGNAAIPTQQSELLSVEEEGLLAGPADHIHFEIQVAGAVGIKLNRRVDVEVLTDELVFFGIIGMLEMPGPFLDLGQTIIPFLNGRIQTIIAAF